MSHTFYTVYPKAKTKDSIKLHKFCLEKEEYDEKRAMKILEQAKTYRFVTTDVYEHEGYGTFIDTTESEIDPETIIVKDNCFFGALLPYVNRFSSIRGDSKTTAWSVATVDHPKALLENAETWNDMNGDSERTVSTVLTKK